MHRLTPTLRTWAAAALLLVIVATGCTNGQLVDAGGERGQGGLAFVLLASSSSCSSARSSTWTASASVARPTNSPRASIPRLGIRTLARRDRGPSLQGRGDVGGDGDASAR